jgi:hypothetical protein
MVVYVFKGYELPYPPGSIGPEIVGTFFFIFIQWARIYVGKLLSLSL